jgi:hypothetical protein
MPHEDVREKVYTAIKALLIGESALTALLATKVIGGTPAVYDEGEPAVQGAKYPYVTVGAGTQIPEHTFGAHGTPKYGWNCTVQIKAVSQRRSPAGTYLSGNPESVILSGVAGVLTEGRDLTLAGYSEAYCEEFTIPTTLYELVAGVPTWSAAAVIRVRCHD